MSKTTTAGAAELTKPTLRENPPATSVPSVAPEAPPKKKFFPVRLLKNYRPAGDFILRPRADPENEFSPRIEREPNAEERLKIRAGWYASLPLDEAKKIIASGVAVRDDEMKVDD